jgi:hypothetical protein
MVKSIPEPCIGCPESAWLVLLSLNPGHSADDEEQHCGVELKEAIFRNLRREPQECPIYPLNPVFAETGVGEWWRDHIDKLQKETGFECSYTRQEEWMPHGSGI